MNTEEKTIVQNEDKKERYNKSKTVTVITNSKTQIKKSCCG